MNTQLSTILLRLEIFSQIFHWQTRSYAQHQAFGKFYGAISGLSDQIVEQLQGRESNRVEFEGTLPLANLHQLDPITLFQSYREELERCLPSVPPNVENLLQEVLGEIDTLLYLLSLS